jgi:hypothetical protein
MPFRTNAALTLTFAAIDTNNRPQRKSGLSWSAGDVKISTDGTSFTNTTNLPSELASTGRYSLALTAAEMNCSWVHIMIVKANMDDIDIFFGTGGYPGTSVGTSGSNTATSFLSNFTEATDDYWKDSLLLFTSGTLAGQLKKVSAYNGTTKFITVSSAFTGIPSSGDRFILVNI